jgi:hypothetical protein
MKAVYCFYHYYVLQHTDQPRASIP